MQLFPISGRWQSWKGFGQVEGEGRLAVGARRTSGMCKKKKKRTVGDVRARTSYVLFDNNGSGDDDDDDGDYNPNHIPFSRVSSSPWAEYIGT